ncbi:MAG: hypothetical protein KBE22_13520 [Candidatus Accumulibacter sp.]|nr:hypothetical protein [Accumulibacter sp.]
MAGMALPSLRFAARRWDLVDPELLNQAKELFSIAALVAPVLLVLGLVLLVLRQGKTGSAAIASGGSVENVATLVIPRNETNSFMRAEALRDAACARIVDQARAASIGVIEQKSNLHSAEVWFRVDYLLPEADPNISLRASVEVHVERHDFHRFEHLYTVVMRVGTEVKRSEGVIEIDDDAASRIQRYVTTPGNKLRLRRQVRQAPWQLWRPANKLTRVRPDWLVLAGTVLSILLVFVPVAGPLLVVVALVALTYWARRRRTYVLTSGRPLIEPRRLRWMDSWQVTVAGLAAATPKLLAQVNERVLRGAPAGLGLQFERIGYWGADGRVEREQIAVRYRRALGFIHVVPYGENLYVGWECHLNSAAWVEEAVARGVDKVTGHLVHANRVVAGTQLLNEYDVADSNFLSEWLHEAIKRELLLQIAEHHIDQEIDFTVQRESRKDALPADPAVPAKKAQRGLLFNRTT